MSELSDVYVVYLAGFKMAFPRMVTPLGPLMVASAIQRSKSYRESDKIVVCATFKEVCRTVESHKHQRVHFLVSSVQVLRGVTTDTNTAIQSARKLKALYPDVKTIVGGPDVSLNPHGYWEHFDLVFEGEIGDVDLVEIIRSGQSHYSAGEVDINAEAVDYPLLRGKNYLAASIQTTRGCPFRCNFCNVISIYGPGTRVLSDEALRARLESLASVHRGLVIISDDNIGGGIPKRAEQVLDVIIEFQQTHDYPFVFAVQASMNLTKKPGFMSKLTRAGVIGAFIGVESPTQEVLVDINKRHNTSDSLGSQIDVFIQHGIFPYMSFIFGLDKEPDDFAQQLKDLLQRCGTPLVGLNLFNPVIGSQLRTEFIEAGRLLEHRTYYEHSLIPAKTARDYAAVIDDYAEIVRWFFDGRRLIGFCSRVVDGTRAHRDEALTRAFSRQISWWSLARVIVLYLILCVRSRTWAGFGYLLRIARGSKMDLLFALAVSGIALGSKCEYVAMVEKLRAGMRELDRRGLYPFGPGPEPTDETQGQLMSW